VHDANGTLELWLVRHGETTYGARKELAGWADPPLTERGRREAESLRPILAANNFSSVWSSDLERALTTSRLAWGEPQVDRRLRELNFGRLEGRHWPAMGDEHNRAILAFREFVAPDGESVAALRARVVEFVESLPAGRHLLFTHGGVIRVLARDLDLDRFVATGTVVALDWRRQELVFLHEPGPVTS